MSKEGREVWIRGLELPSGEEQHCVNVEVQSNGTAKLIEAARNLLEACYQADAAEELSEKIDGSLLDVVRDALLAVPVLVQDEFFKGTFVLEPEDCLPMEELKALLEAGRAMESADDAGWSRAKGMWRAAYEKIREKVAQLR